jgi:hypothetical protein
MRISRTAALLLCGAANAVLVSGAVDYPQSLVFISPTATSYEKTGLVRLQLGDDQTVQLNLTQPFQFFPLEQSAFTKINVCSNGWVSFFESHDAH